ncbi:MAG: methionyl-tRNA formyltransferase [Bacteroidetes bacterium]|nr:methionyl-tRNA formyltransferase [Bacteroidota bacterium]
MQNESPLRIIFMGTPDFAVASLDILVKNKFNIVGVVTAPDKPAGRGLEIHQSAIKKYAVEKGLTILQPEKLKSEEFLARLKALNADLQIVVAFRMLPEIVWRMPRLGTFNLHASLLPQYRGAAPINWAVINGEVESGVTTFFLQHEIDTGKIIYRERVAIDENETAGELHDKLMNTGANLVLKTVMAIQHKSYTETDQQQLIRPGEIPRHAPKIFKDDCRIDWSKSVTEIHNTIRGLSPHPGAFTELVSPQGKIFTVKLFKTSRELNVLSQAAATIFTDSTAYLKVSAKGGYVCIHELQLAGKKRMTTTEFLRGFPINNQWKLR